MNRIISAIVWICVFVTVTTLQGFAEGLTKQQGDAILNELRQIRQLLEKQQRSAPARPSLPERVRLKIGKEFSMGRDDAPLVMVEYTDYQCSFCNRFTFTTFPELKRHYIDTGKMRYISRDFPLESHEYGLEAAQATRCAGEQGKYWEMKDILMTNYERLTPDLIFSLAQQAEIDMSIFEACMDGEKYIPEIKNEISAARTVGITGTPTFVLGKVMGEYLDGYKLVGNQPFQAFDSLAKGILAEENIR